MNSTTFYVRGDGIASSPRDHAVTALEAALRQRRATRAAYGHAILTADYTRPLEERQARYDALSAEVAAAERTLEEALTALEALL